MRVIDIVDSSWHPIINLLSQEPLSELNEKVLPNISYQPKVENIFRVFSKPLNDIKVVILGQDPYPTDGDAIGRAFAVNETRRIPPSLKIIEKEITQTKGIRMINDDNNVVNSSWKTLQHWEDQGVFLLNTALTVETGKAGSHLKYWKNFTEAVIHHISFYNPCIWLLWGRHAQQYKRCIIKNPFYVNHTEETIDEIPSVEDWNYILQAPHPASEIYSGGKSGFYGCNHFLYTNKILNKTKSAEIVW